MEFRTETRRIGGLDVTVTQLSALRALGILPRLARALDGVTDLKRDALRVFSNMSGEELQELVRDLLSSATVLYKGEKAYLSNAALIDVVFTDVMALIEAALFAVEVTFGADFFDGGTSEKPDSGGGSNVASESSSPPKSAPSGPSGDSPSPG